MVRGGDQHQPQRFGGAAYRQSQRVALVGSAVLTPEVVCGHLDPDALVQLRREFLVELKKNVELRSVAAEIHATGAGRQGIALLFEGDNHRASYPRQCSKDGCELFKFSAKVLLVRRNACCYSSGDFET